MKILMIGENSLRNPLIKTFATKEVWGEVVQDGVIKQGARVYLKNINGEIADEAWAFVQRIYRNGTSWVVRPNLFSVYYETRLLAPYESRRY